MTSELTDWLCVTCTLDYLLVCEFWPNPNVYCPGACEGGEFTQNSVLNLREPAYNHI